MAVRVSESRTLRRRRALATWVAGAALAIGALPNHVAAQATSSQAVLDAANSQTVPIAARTLPRGTVLSARDLGSGPANGVSSAVAGRGRYAAPGWITRRVIRAGEVLREPAVVPAPAVRQGQPVEYVYVHDGIELVIPAVAMTAASLGDDLMVRLDGRRRASGVVAAPGRVIARDSRQLP